MQLLPTLAIIVPKRIRFVRRISKQRVDATAGSKRLPWLQLPITVVQHPRKQTLGRLVRVDRGSRLADSEPSVQTTCDVVASCFP